jgi:hypothetical protein
MADQTVACTCKAAVHLHDRGRLDPSGTETPGPEVCGALPPPSSTTGARVRALECPITWKAA